MNFGCGMKKENDRHNFCLFSFFNMTHWALDDLIVHCVEEIAFDGEQGSDEDRLWEFVNDYINKHQVDTRLDDWMKQYLWEQLIQQPWISVRKQVDI
jgi:hypothetical protein